MEIRDFNENNISEKSKEALQSETWQAVRKAAKTEIRHFVDEVLVKDDPYGYPWGQVVDEYLKNGYKEECKENEITVLGETYKVLKREEVTVFYDADGNTLFDVVNERLEKEYEWMLNTSEEPEKETGCQIKNQIEKTGEVDLKCSGDIDEKCADCNKAAVSEDSALIKQKAKEKLEKELKEAKDKNFAEPIIAYLLKRCEEDKGLAQDVVQEHKTWKKCFDYIYEKARKQAKGNYAAVRDDVVYEWAEDYYHRDDKAEEEKKAKEAAERKKKEEERKKKAVEQKKADKKETKQAAKKEDKAEETAPEPPKPKKNPKEIDGQMDMFSMMGM